ncbi:hypothetical protein BO85DRAFT_430258 [Aspergillus piperis CBS 112811]|uniref:Alcohol acetyltransferase n=1 Tax=Aspergillus piperis CBS 112811 TaxID=1448313 RepID=A0A8G1QSY4_9EURO|nr:hypothetical protein BO85DRAFT_430258 [Aspergillus piperis CBS 112811]RAH53079.1 hypothetical protein BO85DRAFT_430258 [Aspergillus piperis CBS 112811]
MDNFEWLRPAGSLEKYFVARNQLGLYSIVAVSATYILPDTFTLPLESYVYKACETLISEHPSLSAIPVQGTDDTTWFMRLPEIDLRQTVSIQRRIRDFPEEDEPDNELCEMLQIQQRTGFVAPLPYWRLVVLTDLDESNEQRFTAVYVFSHAIGDGISGKAFHETFLEALHDVGASLARGEAPEQVIPSPKVPLLPNLEGLHPCSSNFTFLFHGLFRAKIWPYNDPSLWTGPKVFVPIKTRIRQIIFPATISAAFRKNCRERKTTITSALHAAVAHALFNCLPNNYTKLQATGAMSARRWLNKGGGITDRSMGNWVMDYKERFFRDQMNQYPPGAFPWNEARKSRETTEQILGQEGKNTSVALLKYAGNIHDVLQGKIGKDRSASYKVSNLGILISGRRDPSRPQITRVMFSQPLDVLGGALAVSLVSGEDGALVLGMTWQEGIENTEFFEAVIDTVVKDVHNAAK